MNVARGEFNRKEYMDIGQTNLNLPAEDEKLTGEFEPERQEVRSKREQDLDVLLGRLERITGTEFDQVDRDTYHLIGFTFEDALKILTPEAVRGLRGEEREDLYDTIDELALVPLIGSSEAEEIQQKYAKALEGAPNDVARKEILRRKLDELDELVKKWHAARNKLGEVLEIELVSN